MPTYDIVNPAESLQTYKPMSLGEMVNLGRGMQQYKSENIELQKAQQANTERLAIQDWMSNPDNYTVDIGGGQRRVDVNKLAHLNTIAPLTGGEWQRNLLNTAYNETVADQAKTNLTTEAKTNLAQVFRATALSGSNNKQDYYKAMDEWAATSGSPYANQLVTAYKNNTANLPEEDPSVNKTFLLGSATLMPQSDLNAAYGPKPGVVQTPTGAFTTSTQVNPATGAVSTTVAGQPFMTQSQIEATGGSDVNGNPTYYIKDARGNIIGQTTTPEAITFSGQGNQPIGQGGQPTGQTPGRPVFAPQADVEQGNRLRLGASQAAMQYPTATANSNEIIRLAPTAMTGTGSDLVRSLSGNVLFQSVMGTGDEASKLDSLGHYLSLQTSSLSQNSGLSGTDAANQLAGEISGTKQWTPQAIVKTSRVNRALAYSSKLLSDGYNKAYKDSNRDPTSSVRFQEQWANTVDMDSIRLMDAFNNKAQDPTGFDELVKEMGGNKSARFLSAANKINAINSLVGKK